MRWLKVAIVVALVMAAASLALNFRVLQKLDNLDVIVVPVVPQSKVLPDKEDIRLVMGKKSCVWLPNRIANKYKTTPEFVEEVIGYAVKYEAKDFPKARHILAVVGIESSWRDQAKSRLSVDKAYGLTQVRAGVWKHLLSPKGLASREEQIRVASLILQEYHRRLRTEKAAITAYNWGITNYRNGIFDNKYWVKYNRELGRLRS